MRPYDAPEYWEGLLARGFDESTVGYAQLAVSLNAAMYRSTRGAVRRALVATRLDPTGRRVLDVGSGTGVWIDFWERLGAGELTGVDLTASSVAGLRERWPAHRFVQADLGDADAKLPRDNDIVSAMSVLLHIVDEPRFRRAVANLAGALRPGGALIAIEPVVMHRWWGPPFDDRSNSRARPIDVYEQTLGEAGLTLELVRPATALLSNVIDTRTRVAFRALEIYWSLLNGVVGRRETVGAIAASLLGPIDSIATRLARTGHRPRCSSPVARRCVEAAGPLRWLLR